jgi:serine/threonine protein kinase
VASTISSDASELILSLLKADPTRRLTFEEIFEHPWLKRFEKE